jgi:hypothetical protein
LVKEVFETGLSLSRNLGKLVLDMFELFLSATVGVTTPKVAKLFVISSVMAGKTGREF